MYEYIFCRSQWQYKLDPLNECFSMFGTFPCFWYGCLVLSWIVQAPRHQPCYVKVQFSLWNCQSQRGSSSRIDKRGCLLLSVITSVMIMIACSQDSGNLRGRLDKTLGQFLSTTILGSSCATCQTRKWCHLNDEKFLLQYGCSMTYAWHGVVAFPTSLKRASFTCRRGGGIEEIFYYNVMMHETLPREEISMPGWSSGRYGQHQSSRASNPIRNQIVYQMNPYHDMVLPHAYEHFITSMISCQEPKAKTSQGWLVGKCNYVGNRHFIIPASMFFFFSHPRRAVKKYFTLRMNLSKIDV